MFRDSALQLIRAQRRATRNGFPLASRPELIRVLRESRDRIVTLATNAPAAIPPELAPQIAHADHSTLLIAYLDALIDAKNGDPHAHEIADALHAMLHGENVGWRKHAPVTMLATHLALPHLPAIQQAHATIKAHPQALKQSQQRESLQRAAAAEQAAQQKAAEKAQEQARKAAEKAANRPGTANNPLQLPKKDRPLPKPPPIAKPVPLGNQRVVAAMRSNLKHPEFNPFHPHHEEALHDLHAAMREHKKAGTAESEANLEAAKRHFVKTTAHPDASVLNRPDIGLRVGAVSSGLRNARHMGTPGSDAHDYATETAARHAQEAGPYQSYGRHQPSPEPPETEEEPPTVQSTASSPVPPPPPPGGFKQDLHPGGQPHQQGQGQGAQQQQPQANQQPWKNPWSSNPDDFEKVEHAPAPGMTRLYHGGFNPTSGGSRWVTPYRSYAEGYAKKGGNPLHYIDLPSDHQIIQEHTDTNATGPGSAPMNFELPEEFAKQFALHPDQSRVSSGNQPVQNPAAQPQQPIKLEPGKPNPFTGRVIRHPNAHWDPTTNSVIYPTGGTAQQPQQQQPGQPGQSSRAQALAPENPHAAAIAAKIVAHHQNPNAPPPTTEGYKQFAEHAATMPTQQQVSIRNEVLGSVDNPQMKEQMANALRHGLAAKFEHGAQLRPNPDLDTEFAKPIDGQHAEPGHPSGPAIPGTPPSRQIQPGRAYNVPTSSLHVDPDRFQYKLHMGAGGVGDTLKGVKYNPTFGGILLVWRDPANRQDYVINGHHRYELAARSQHPDLNVQYIDARDAVEARSVGALANIAEGHGTALDAAKFLRDSGLTPEEMKAKHQISLKGKVAADAAILSKLSDPLFHKVTVGQLDEDRAKAIAEHLAADPTGQAALLGYIEQQETDRGRDIPPKVVEQLAREWAAAPKTENDQPDLFGDAEDRSTFLDRAVLKTRLRADLVKRLNDFLAVSSKRRETAVRGAGNRIEVDKNQEAADEARNLLDTFDRLSPYKGELQDILNEEGLKYANARNQKARDIAATNAGVRIRNFLRQAGRTGSAVPVDRGTEIANRPAGVQAGGEPEGIPPAIDRRPAADGGGGGTAGVGGVGAQGGVDYASLSKEQMKELAKSMPAPESLPEDHAKYFKRVDGEQIVPIDKIRNLRARPEGIENAAKFMEISRRGGPKREPIKVVAEPDGTYTVADGNSTFANAKKNGWSSLPVQVVSHEWMQAEQKKTIDKEHAKAIQNLAHEKLFTPDELNLGKQASNQQTSREEIAAVAPQVKREYDNALNTGKGLDLALGARVFDPAKLPEGMSREQKYQAYIEAFKQPGPVVLLAPLKNLEGRAQEKVNADLNGDWSKLHDVVRGTVGVDSLHNLPGAVAKLKEEMARRGFSLVKTPKNRFGGKPTLEGYRDLNLSFSAPNGLVTEVQVNTKPMLIAKEEGHKYYEISRSIVAGAKKAGRDELTEDEARRVSEAIGKQRDIYTEGYLRSLGVHEEGNSNLIAHAREQLEKQYNEDWQSDLQEMGLKDGIESLPGNQELPDLHGNGRIPAESGRSAPTAETAERSGAVGDRGGQPLHEGRGPDIEGRVRPDGWGNLAAMSGAPKGAKVATFKTEHNGIDRLHVTTDHDGVKSERIFSTDPKTGKKTVTNYRLDIDPKSPYKGQGYRLFADQVKALRDAGVSTIKATGSGDQRYAASGGDSGYYALARMGYDGEIPIDAFDRMPDSIKKAMGDDRSIRKLMDEVPGGKEAWKQYGEDFRGTFDLSPNSKSSVALERYVREREQRESRPATTLATEHAPVGGSDADGKHFEGGQFVPSGTSGEQSPNGQEAPQSPAPTPENDLSEHPEGEMPAVRALKGLWEHARESGSIAIVDDAKDVLSQFSTAALYDAFEEFGHPEYRELDRGNLLKRIYGWLDWMATTSHKPEPGQPPFYDTHYNPPFPKGQPVHAAGTPQNPMPLPSAITPHQVAAAYRQAKKLSDDEFDDIGEKLESLSREDLNEALVIIGIRPNPSVSRERLIRQIHEMIGERRK